jgi:hypothetical protein
LQNENISRSDLQVWALAKPCQIAPLARIVVESSSGPAVFKVLVQLPEIVNALCEVKPSWLESLLERAAASSIESSPAAYPIDWTTFLTCGPLNHEALFDPIKRLIKGAASRVTAYPNEASLRLLSELCTALPGNILEFFGEELMGPLSSRCKEVCSGSLSTNNDIEMMLAQDILAQLAIAFQTPTTPSKSSLETPPGATFSEASRGRVFKMFSDQNASTTLKLAVLRLSMFISEESRASTPIALEGVNLAQRIIAPIGMHLRRQWVENNSKLVEKFLSRLNREGLDLNIRLQVGIRSGSSDSKSRC